MKNILKTVITAGLLIVILASFSGCLATDTTTPDNGETTTTSWLGQYGMIIFLVVIFVFFYLVMIRPQRKRQKEQQEMIAAIQKGDRVITAGGIYGVVDNVREDSVVLKVEGGTLLRIAKGSVMVLKDEIQK